MPVNTDDALVLKAGQHYRLDRARERMSRVAIGRMTQRATLYRPVDVVGGNSRLTEVPIVVDTDIPCVVEGWRMPNEQTMDSAYGYEIADKKGHFPLGTDLRRNDFVVIEDITYIILGMHGPSGNLVELVVLMRTSLGDGESMLP